MPVVPAITSISDVEFAADEESYKGAAASSDAERRFLQSDVLVLKQPVLPLSKTHHWTWNNTLFQTQQFNPAIHWSIDKALSTSQQQFTAP